MKKKDTVSDNVYGKKFLSRAAVCYFLILFMLLSCVLRVSVIMSGNYGEVAAKQSQYRIKVKKVRGTIYDCNMIPLTNNKRSVVAVVSPTARAAMAASSLLEGDKKEKLLDDLKHNKPSVCTLPEMIECEGIACTYVYETEGSPDACHVIGYLDSDGHGAAGLQSAYDGLLYSDAYISAVVEINGKGNVIVGSQPYFEAKSSAQTNAVVSTVDINMQNAVFEAAKDIKRGAVLLAEAKTGKIRAMVSIPQYDTSDISAYLDDENSPFLNRALQPYSVGSVFKLCVAAAGIEKGKGNYVFNCEGSSFIIDRYFKCHKEDGHGEVDLKNAIAQSCNCFFYNYAVLIGGESIYKTARTFAFGAPIKIADNIKTKAGTLPSTDTLKNPAQLANFSIGQGELSLSPVALLTLYSAIANGGRYYIPSLVEKTVCEGEINEYDKGNPTVVMSKDTADTIREYLKSVITDGTAPLAAPATVTAAGKTATAQTGRKNEDGGKINNSWFCGFFPADNPEYVAVILSEGGTSSATCKIFADIADKITEISKAGA